MRNKYFGLEKAGVGCAFCTNIFRICNFREYHKYNNWRKLECNDDVGRWSSACGDR